MSLQKKYFNPRSYKETPQCASSSIEGMLAYLFENVSGTFENRACVWAKHGVVLRLVVLSEIDKPRSG